MSSGSGWLSSLTDEDRRRVFGMARLLAEGHGPEWLSLSGPAHAQASSRPQPGRPTRSRAEVLEAVPRGSAARTVRTETSPAVPAPSVPKVRTAPLPVPSVPKARTASSAMPPPGRPSGRPSSAPREGEGVGPYRDLPSPSPEAAAILRGELRTSWLELGKALEQAQARRAERERRESRGGPTWWEWLGDGLRDPQTFPQPLDPSSYEKARRDMAALVNQAEQMARDRRADSSLHAGKLPPPLARPATRPLAPQPVPEPSSSRRPRLLSPEPSRPAEGLDELHHRLMQELPRGDAAIRAPLSSVPPAPPSPSPTPPSWSSSGSPAASGPVRSRSASGRSESPSELAACIGELVRIRVLLEKAVNRAEPLPPPLSAPPPRTSGRM
ncbi:MAG TPA: hypothetical protein VFF52_19835 [Isosphaeraceae bacterium]|nr:hypothetical protein [Isosphaeraceae bacterium]